MSYELLFEAIDSYCERLRPDFWAEPVNALSNIFICLAGLFFYFKKSKNKWVLIFSANAIVAGIGSFLFHTTAQRWSLFVDLVPIYLFIVIYVFFIFRYLFSYRRITAIFAALLFITLNFIIANIAPKEFLNGSVVYLPSMFFLLLCMLITRRRNLGVFRYYATATVVFSASLLARSIDLALCEVWPLGTHFIWHTLNGFLFYFLIKAAEEVGAPKDSVTK
jgi:hypothetical protein